MTSVADRHHLDSVFLELRLVACAVVTVTGESIQLPDDDYIKQLFAAVFNHILKL